MKKKVWLMTAGLGLLAGLSSAVTLLIVAGSSHSNTSFAEQGTTNTKPLTQPANGASGANAKHPSPTAKLSLPKDALSWDELAKVTLKQDKNNLLPVFPQSVLALNDRTVKLFGFMIPIKAGDKHDRFLVTFNPQTCAFCMPAGPEGLVEVIAKRPIAYSYEPIFVEGVFVSLTNDPNGLYYRLVDAEQRPYAP